MMATPSSPTEKVPYLLPNEVISAIGDRVTRWWGMGGAAHHLVELERSHELKKEHEHDQDGGARAVVETWLQEDPQPSWRKLITALDRAEESSAADAIRKYAEPLRDPTLTVENVGKVMRKVKNWGKVGVTCGVPHHKIVSIEKTHSTDEDRSYAVGEYCIHTFHGICWEGISGALYYGDEHEALAEASKYFWAPQDTTLTTKNLMEVLKGKEGLWWILCQWTGVPQSKRDAINDRYHTDIQKMEAFLDHWHRTCPAASWKIVAKALTVMGEKDLAEEITKRYVRASVRSKEIIEAAMKEGYIISRNTKVVLVGAAGSGKTCTLALIIEKPPPALRSSTPLAKRPVRVLILEKTGNSWRLVNKHGISQLITNQAMSFHTTSDEEVPTTPPAPSESTQGGRLWSIVKYFFRGPAVDQSAQAQMVEGRSSSETQTVEEELGLQIDSANACLVSNREIEMVYVIDSGGQPQFHEVLPVFLWGASLFLFVQKLNEALSAYPEVVYYRDGKAIGEPFRSSFSNQQILRHCLQVIQSQASLSPEEDRPQLAFVGTHRDLEHECPETREEKNEALGDMLPQALKDSVHTYGLRQWIFPLNAKSPDAQDHDVAAELRKVIEKCPVEKRPVPLRWHGLDVAIHSLMKNLEREVLSVDECREAAQLLHFDDDNFNEALKYLHKLNNIFNFDRCRVVFGNAQIPLDKLTELLEHLYTLQGGSAAGKAISGQERKFCKQGVITKGILQHFVKHYVRGLFEPADLLVLFQDLLIVADIGNGEYLMPCLLPVDQEIVDCPATCHDGKSPPVSTAEVSSGMPTAHQSPPLEEAPPTQAQGCPAGTTAKLPHSRLAPRFCPLSSDQGTVPPLLLHFPDGPLLGQLCLLTAYLLSEAKWKLLRSKGEIVKVTRNSVKFEIPECPGTVTLCDPFSTYFKVCVDIPVDCQEVCSSIRNTILTGLRKASENLHYQVPDPEDAFLCQGQDGNGCESPPHAATVCRRQQYLKCTAKPGSVHNSKLHECHKVWLGLPVAVKYMRLDDRPTLPQLLTFHSRDRVIDIPQEIGTKFKEFGTFLLNDTMGEKVDALAFEFSNNSKRINIAILQDWLQSGEKQGNQPVTWETLIQVLSDTNLNTLSSDIRKAVL